MSTIASIILDKLGNPASLMEDASSHNRAEAVINKFWCYYLRQMGNYLEKQWSTQKKQIGCTADQVVPEHRSCIRECFPTASSVSQHAIPCHSPSPTPSPSAPCSSRRLLIFVYLNTTSQTSAPDSFTNILLSRRRFVYSNKMSSSCPSSSRRMMM